MPIDSGYAAWLQAPALYTTDSDATTVTRWGAKAIETEIMSPFALKAAADTEADRQVTFLCGPLVKDNAVVPGLRSDLVGQPITLQGNDLGYTAGIAVFVLGAEEQEGNMTVLTVLRKLT